MSGRTFWSQLSSQRCPLLVRRFLLNKPSLPSELGNSDSRDWKHTDKNTWEIRDMNYKGQMFTIRFTWSKSQLTLSCSASSWGSLKIRPFSSGFTSSCKLKSQTLHQSFKFLFWFSGYLVKIYVRTSPVNIFLNNYWACSHIDLFCDALSLLSTTFDSIHSYFKLSINVNNI